MANRRSFYETLTAAVKDLTENGFDTEGRLAFWVEELRKSAETTLTPVWKMDALLRKGLGTLYQRLIEKGGIAKWHPGISRFTLQKLQPQLRAELDRRIMASANLIKMNREKAIQDTLQRFAGWSTSIPAGGTEAVNKRKTKEEISKSLAQLSFRERRVAIDQGHKFTAALSEIIAKDEGALAVVWHSHWRDPAYNYRKDHKERDGHVYALKGNWAMQQGLMKVGADGYYDDITHVGEEVYCRCFATYIYGLSQLPKDMLTQKGAAEVERVKAEMKKRYG